MIMVSRRCWLDDVRCPSVVGACRVSSEEAALKHMEGCSQLHAHFDEQGTAAATAASASSGGLASSEMAASGFVSDVRNTLQKQRQREAERQQ